MSDYYRILDLAQNASQAEIKAQYRRLARECHPDVSEGPQSAERFKSITEAYETLSDEDKRASYDNELAERYQKTQTIPNSSLFSSPFWGELRTAAFHFATDIIDHLGNEPSQNENLTNLVQDTTTIRTRKTTSGGVSISVTLSGTNINLISQKLAQGLPLDDYGNEVGDVVSQKIVQAILAQFRYS